MRRACATIAVAGGVLCVSAGIALARSDRDPPSVPPTKATVNEAPAVVREQQPPPASRRPAFRTLDYDFVAEDAPPRRPLESEQQWYGWQTLAADGAALTMIVIGANQFDSGGDGLVTLWMGTYVFGG